MNCKIENRIPSHQVTKRARWKEHLKIAVLMPAFFIPVAAMAQNVCGNELINAQLRAMNPNFDAQLAQNIATLKTKTDNLQLYPAAAKGTGSVYKIQVVFHFVLDSAQVNQLGGNAGIQARITSQLLQLNTDWGAHNADSTKIPTAFKPLYGNMNIQFVLAGKTPSGTSSAGYDIKYTGQTSYDLQSGTAGTKLAYSDVKYSSAGGTDAWDPSRYYNVWVANLTPAGVLGLSTPPRHPPYDQFPQEEQGSVILYGAFGRKTIASQYFTYVQATEGRTLTHESGHFFNLFHTFGSDNTCNDDDGISDTPLQAAATANNAPVFPVLDACSANTPGIMFMNFMDYAIDSSQYMFSKGQVVASHIELDPGGLRNSLVVAAATDVEPLSNNSDGLRVFPNPAKNTCVIELKNASINQVIIIDITGRRIVSQPGNNQENIAINLSGLVAGTYLVEVRDNSGRLAGYATLIKQ